MIKRHRDLLRAVVADLRHTLSGGPNGQRGDLDRELERLGIAPDGSVTPFDALPNPSAVERRARRVAEAQLAAAPAAQRAAARADVVERAAYTWINRLLALRAAEARGLINEILRSDPAYDGLSEALFILRQTQPQRAAGPDGGWWAVIEDACRAQAASLPGLFDLADPSAALRPSVPALLRCVAIVGGADLSPGPSPAKGGEFTREEMDAAFADPDAIGWAYQFYQEEAKARTYAKLNSGGKAATRAEIAAVTQLFTEPYMVKWLLQNSLGRTYHELYPDSKLPDTWEYYIRQRSGDAEGQGDDSPGHLVTPSPCQRLEDLTFMDPCMGSGHFEREAFDMVFAMYREQHGEMTATEIADRILTRHLHGIDLDPRAAQLAALTLYLRAWELVRAEQRTQRRGDPSAVARYRPPAMNLATTPTGLTPGSLERHLQRHPEDRIYRPLLEGIFAALEQADVLGSLLRPGEQLDAAIRAFRTQGGGQLGLLAEDDDLNRLLGELARHDPSDLKRVLLERIARSFAAEAADADDVATALFGREAGEGVRLLELLDRRYAVVATNPPYMGSGNADPTLIKFIERFYAAGKRDLYSAFILRCMELAAKGGYVAMITLQSWLSKDSFYELRMKVLMETVPEIFVVLGRYAFSEVDPPGLPTVFVIANREPRATDRIWSASLGRAMEAQAQAVWLRGQVTRSNMGEGKYILREQITGISQKPLLLGFTAKLLSTLTQSAPLSDHLVLCEPLTTGENERYVRLIWEVSLGCRWKLMSKGGGFRRWRGLEFYTLDWRFDGAAIKASPGSYIRNEEMMFEPGFTFSAMSRHGISFRQMPPQMTFGKAGPGIFAPSMNRDAYLILLNSRVYGFWLRKLNPGASITLGSVGRLPTPPASVATRLDLWMEPRVKLSRLQTQTDAREADFVVSNSGAILELTQGASQTQQPDTYRIAEVIGLALDGYFDHVLLSDLDLEADSVTAITETSGECAGALPLIAGYDDIPDLSAGFQPAAPWQQFLKYLAGHRRLILHDEDLQRFRVRLRALYEAGSSIEELLDMEDEDEEDPQVALTISVPRIAGSFIEEISQLLGFHPISVYWLLEELRAEGVRCKPEELRLLEDRLSVLALRLLGHRWPRQLQAGEPVPSWADPDGIIPLTAVAGEASLAERVRGRLRAEEGDRGAQQVEALLLELTGQTLDEWLRRTFFARHVRQFKHRPIAWHLASTPTKDGGRKKARREPAFQCLLYYHACRGDVLARLRAHYVEPLIRLETAAAAEARRRGDETAAAIAVSRVQELEEFAARLREVEESGFACAELDRLLAGEPLDRWCGDGIVPPASADELAAQERAWRVDINDGVRVNIAPLQLAGLLTSDVLRPDDARKAIADRARWRSDERRWVREGVLPRCGWMDEDVPESPRWTDRAPEREAEQRKLEEKRRAVMERIDCQA